MAVRSPKKLLFRFHAAHSVHMCVRIDIHPENAAMIINNNCAAFGGGCVRERFFSVGLCLIANTRSTICPVAPNKTRTVNEIESLSIIFSASSARRKTNKRTPLSELWALKTYIRIDRRV